MRILISTDMHANILAAEEADKAGRYLGADLHVHLGDSLDIGPWPEETFQFMKSRSVVMIKGNHEEYHCSDGYGPVIEKRMGAAERNHYEWTTAQLSPDSIETLEVLPYEHRIAEGGRTFRFTHFPLKNGRICEPWIETDEEGMTEPYGAAGREVLFFGHIHRWVDDGVNPRFICPGATGISQYPEYGKTLLLLDIGKGGYSLERHRMAWDMERVKREVRRVNRNNRNWLLDNMYRA